MLLAASILSVFTLLGPDGQTSVRALTAEARCPAIHIDGTIHPMLQRVGPAVVAGRAEAGQADRAAAHFPSRVCEADLPPGARSVSVDGRRVALPAAQVDRFVVFGDSGCRMKAGDKRFQACNDAAAWPLAAVAKAAARLKPQLVVQLGDIHYRESPCPEGNAGCAGSPWGYGEDTWRADILTPAQPLLAAAPWVFARGNHESCARAGVGWFRFFDHAAWSPMRSCDNPADDANADFSAPFAVPLGGGAQLIVFDSSRSSGKAYAANDPAMLRYQDALRQADALGAKGEFNIFVSHHPLLGIAPAKDDGRQDLGPSVLGLYSAAKAIYPHTVLPPTMHVGLHGHVHLFEALSFAGGQAPSVISGTGGSEVEGSLPAQLPTLKLPFPDLELNGYRGHDRAGFTLFERTGKTWALTSFDVNGKPLAHCSLAGKQLQCS